jgi:hypothetical protein
MNIEEQVKHIEHEVRKLHELYKNGLIDLAERDKILSSLSLSYLGCKWMLGIGTNQWYRNQGVQWIRSVSPLEIREEMLTDNQSKDFVIDDSVDLKALLDNLHSKKDE